MPLKYFGFHPKNTRKSLKQRADNVHAHLTCPRPMLMILGTCNYITQNDKIHDVRIKLLCCGYPKRAGRGWKFQN